MEEFKQQQSSEENISFELTTEDLEVISKNFSVVRPNQIGVSQNGFSIRNAPVPKSRF